MTSRPYRNRFAFDEPELNHQPQASKPHARSSPVDAMPMVYRPGSLDATKLPSRTGNTLTYKDGRKEILK